MHRKAALKIRSVDIRIGVEADSERRKEAVEPKAVMIPIEIVIPVEAPAMSRRHHAAVSEIAAMKGDAAVAHHSPAAVAHHSAAAVKGRRR
jgi:hypothetical protein